MKKIIGRLLMLLGLVMVLASAGLLLYNRREDGLAGESAALVLQALETAPAPSAPEAESQPEPEVPREEMTVKTIDGREYIGTLMVPNLNLELPVLSEWSYDGLKIAPGRYTGSTFTEDLTICAHNYAAHFGRLSSLEPGATIRFRDMDGLVWTYEVSEITELGPLDVADMTEKGPQDTWSLTLFTCTPGGETRVTVRCQRTGIVTE